MSALVLDPCYRGTPIEKIARGMPCELRWHSGYRVAVEVIQAHPTFRGEAVVAAAEAIAVDGELTPPPSVTPVGRDGSICRRSSRSGTTWADSGDATRRSSSDATIRGPPT